MYAVLLLNERVRFTPNNIPLLKRADTVNYFNPFLWNAATEYSEPKTLHTANMYFPFPLSLPNDGLSWSTTFHFFATSKYSQI